MNNYLLDIDGTICEDIPNEEAHRFPDAKVMDRAVEIINELFDAGHTIVFFTSRKRSEHYDATHQWLKKHGFKFHYIIFDKPRGGNYYWVDNLDVTAIKFKGDWECIRKYQNA